MSVKIDIVLASYNGEKYIDEFIKSLISQTHQNWRLIISDDSSQDNTLSIINHHIASESRIILVNQARQGGVVSNFNKALAYVDADYIMFADQDDLWKPNKLTNSINKFREIEQATGNTVPLLLFTDLTLADEKLEIIAPSFYRYHGFDPLNNLLTNYLSWCSTLYGCTALFNRALLTVVYPIDHRVLMHDQIFAFFASLLGRVIFLDEQTVLYRQHESNVIGGARNRLDHKLKNFINYYKKVENYHKKIISQANFINERLSKIDLDLDLDLDRLSFLSCIVSSNLFARLQFWKTCIQPFLFERTSLNLVLSWLLLVKR
ncbi:MAG: glycosyltransferase family 2 protein [Nodosilinea sp.]